MHDDTTKLLFNSELTENALGWLCEKLLNCHSQASILYIRQLCVWLGYKLVLKFRPIRGLLKRILQIFVLLLWIKTLLIILKEYCGALKHTKYIFNITALKNSFGFNVKGAVSQWRVMIVCRGSKLLGDIISWCACSSHAVCCRVYMVHCEQRWVIWRL